VTGAAVTGRAVEDAVDLLVVGGGPVGLACAIEARRRGLSVVVVEPRATPVDKACGEGVMPGALAALGSLGVDPPGQPFVGIRYLGGGRQVEASFRVGPGRGVRRTDLHAVLAGRAEQVGVETVRDRVRTVTQDADGVTAAGRRARWLVGADGLHSDVRQEIGVAVPPRPGAGPGRFGLRRHYAVAPWSDHVEVYWGRRGEVYVTPVAADLVGVAVLTRAGVGFDEALADVPALRARLRGADPVTDVRGAGPLRQRVSAVRRGRVLLVGDAAGYVDALTGEGLAAGLASARAAVDAITAGRPDAYPAAWTRATRRSRVLTEGLLAVAGSDRARGRLVPVAARAPRTFACIVNLLA
jgi:flavin-dependent dehydrogenase